MPIFLAICGLILIIASIYSFLPADSPEVEIIEAPYPKHELITKPAVKTIKINLNTATRIELDSLPGIGEVSVAKIIQGRPYKRVAELVERKIINQSVFEKIKDQISL